MKAEHIVADGEAELSMLLTVFDTTQADLQPVYKIRNDDEVTSPMGKSLILRRLDLAPNIDIAASLCTNDHLCRLQGI